MAYLDLTIGSPVTEARAMTPIGLSAIERRVVMLSRRDERSSLSRPGRIGRLLRNLTGVRQANALADERLETLRQYAVLIRLNQAGRAAILENKLQSLGFTVAALTQIRGLVDGFATPALAATRWGAAATLTVAAIGGYAFSASYFNDGQLGAVTGGMLFAMLAPVVLSQSR